MNLLIGCAPISSAARPPQTKTLGKIQANSPTIALSNADARWGSPQAVVTIVAFLDFECPFCANVHTTLAELRTLYGQEQLRLFIKHSPLQFHRRGLPAAYAAQAVLVAGGMDAFLAYVGRLFEDATALSDENLERLAVEQGIDRQRFRLLLASPEVRNKVKVDQRQARKLQVEGVPAFFINGARLEGAQPLTEFRRVIDHELRAGAALMDAGIAPNAIYAQRVQVNFDEEALASRAEPEPEPALRVPLGSSPKLGPDGAAVTIVEFIDFECPFCSRVHETIETLMTQYPGQVRWVLKHAPLPFHKAAIPAALVAIEARRQKGEAAFWAATERLLLMPALSTQGLQALAKELELEQEGLEQALRLGGDHPRLVTDQDQAMDLEARGTPHFFINGRRLAGAQPPEAFQALIEEELERVRTLSKTGEDTYTQLQRQAAVPPGMHRVQLDVPASGQAPSRGPADAPVVIQVFSDLECPYCQRVMPTLRTLQERYHGKIRLVWRHLPLPFHQRALPAAKAAIAVWKQQGDAAFWNYVEALLAEEDSALSQENLEQAAQRLELDLEQFRSLQASDESEALISADRAAAAKAGVTGTPAFIIDGYRLFGAQPLRRFERLVRLVLAERSPQRPMPAPAPSPTSASVQTQDSPPAAPATRPSTPEPP